MFSQKPANCLVNQDCSVRVCDFGLARTIDFGDGASVADATNANSGGAQPPQEDYLPDVPHNKHLKRQLTGHVVTRCGAVIFMGCFRTNPLVRVLHCREIRAQLPGLVGCAVGIERRSSFSFRKTTPRQ